MKNANPVSARLRTLAAALFALAAAGCGSGRRPERGAAPEVRRLRMRFTIEVGGHPARLPDRGATAPEQERGLMDRSDLGKDEGMVFMYAKPAAA